MKDQTALMNNNHVKLEKRSQNLYKQGRSLFKEDRKEYEELRKYKTLLFHDIFWRRRKPFALIMEKFVNDSIDMEQFETEFSLFYHRTIEVYEMFQKDFKILEKLQVDPRPYELRFSSFIVSIFRQFEVLEDEECSEQDVKDLVQNNLLLMQPYLEFADEIDMAYYKNLKRAGKIQYARSKLSRSTIISYQNEIAKQLIPVYNPNTYSVGGIAGKKKVSTQLLISKPRDIYPFTPAVNSTPTFPIFPTKLIPVKFLKPNILFLIKLYYFFSGNDLSIGFLPQCLPSKHPNPMRISLPTKRPVLYAG